MVSPYQGILGKSAPPWEVEEWFNLPEGKTKLELSDFTAKVIYLYCFQSWCPGCHSHGFPILKEVKANFKGADALAFVAIQTVFEGFQANTLEAARETAERHD